MTTKQLSERRKADRETMATRVMEIAAECGTAAERLGEGDCDARNEAVVKLVAPGGLCLTVDFDGKSIQPDVFVMSWHMHYKSNNLLNEGTFGGNVNPHHFAKATYIGNGFDDLCVKLRAGLMMCADGSAYQQPVLPVDL